MSQCLSTLQLRAVCSDEVYANADYMYSLKRNGRTPNYARLHRAILSPGFPKPRVWPIALDGFFSPDVNNADTESDDLSNVSNFMSILCIRLLYYLFFDVKIL